jgi:uncharacterized damage-inducible protein DinB
MTLTAHYRMFGHYNAWANRRLYDAAARLSPEQYHADRGAFFKSVHGTLNHLLVTDRIWMHRFTGEGDAPSRLDAILFETLDGLRAAREDQDRRIVDFVDRLDDARIAGTIRYRRVSSPEAFEQQVAPALAHWFNHQPPPRAGPCAPDRSYRRSAGARPAVFPAAAGKTHRLNHETSRRRGRRRGRHAVALGGANAAKLCRRRQGPLIY